MESNKTMQESKPIIFHQNDLKESINIANLPNFLEKINENLKIIEQKMNQKELESFTNSNIIQNKNSLYPISNSSNKDSPMKSNLNKLNIINTPIIQSKYGADEQIVENIISNYPNNLLNKKDFKTMENNNKLDQPEHDSFKPKRGSSNKKEKKESLYEYKINRLNKNHY